MQYRDSTTPGAHIPGGQRTSASPTDAAAPGGQNEVSAPTTLALPPIFLMVGLNLGIRYASSSAELYLKRGNPLGASAGRLVVNDSTLKMELLPALRAAGEPSVGKEAPGYRSWLDWQDPVSGAVHMYRLTSVRIPTGTAEHWQWLAGVFVDAPDISHDPVESYATRYRLSRTEHRLVALLVAGHDLKSAAHHLGQRISTTRTVLKKVFLKTDTHRQSELIGNAMRE